MHACVAVVRVLLCTEGQDGSSSVHMYRHAVPAPASLACLWQATNVELAAGKAAADAELELLRWVGRRWVGCGPRGRG